MSIKHIDNDCVIDYVIDILPLVDYAFKEYPELIFGKSENKFRRRFYEKAIITEILSHFLRAPWENPTDILESYELVYTHYAGFYNCDISKIQLGVIKNLLSYSRRMII